MAKWGDTEFKIRHGTLKPPQSDGGLNKIKILADPAQPTEHVEVLQQSGKTREVISFRVVEYPASLTFYNALITDRDNATERTFQGPSTSDPFVTGDYIVESVGNPDYQGVSLFFDVRLVEA